MVKKSRTKVKKKGTAKTKVTNDKTGTEIEETEEVGGLLFTDPHCTVALEVSHTINLGNFESLKIGVTLAVPCKHDEIDDTFEFVQDWVDNKIIALKDEEDQ